MSVIIKDLNSPHTVTITDSETILGRGPLLKCSDKRISRSHAKLQLIKNDKGEEHVFLIALHGNLPCYYRKKGESVKTENIEPNTTKELFDGDVFSLLPDKFVFEVNIIQDNGTPATTDNLQSDTAVVDEANMDESTAGISCTITNKPKKRVLPAWLVQSAKGDDAEPKKVKKAGKSNEEAPEKNKGKTKDNDVQQIKKQRIKADDEDETQVKKTEKVQVKPEKKKDAKAKKDFHGMSMSDAEEPMSGDDDAGPDDAEQSTSNSQNDVKVKKTGKRNEHPDQNKGKAKDEAMSDDEGTDAEAQSASTSSQKQGGDKKDRRTACMYGDKCYRKNPAHRDEYSHPGDEDYKTGGASGSDSEDDDKPECVYGILCYRKNEQHKKQYKHTQRPARKAAQRADEKRKKMLDDDDDEGSYESSFIDDDSDEYLVWS